MDLRSEVENAGALVSSLLHAFSWVSRKLKNRLAICRNIVFHRLQQFLLFNFSPATLPKYLRLLDIFSFY